MSSGLKKQENIQKAQVFLQAAHLYQTSKIAKELINNFKQNGKQLFFFNYN